MVKYVINMQFSTCNKVVTPPKVTSENFSFKSLPDSEGMPLFCDWEPLKLSGWLSAVPSIHLASYWDGNEGGQGGLRWCCLHGTAWPFEPSRAHCLVNWPCSTQKVRSVRLDHCACPAAWLLWSVLSVRREVEQASWLFAGAFSRNIPLSAVLLSCFCGERHDISIVCQRNMACRVGCFPFRWFQKAYTEKSY